MTPIEIIRLGRDMRTAQKEYFRTRMTTHLNKSKHLEKEFDKAVQEFFNPNRQFSFDNFDSSSSQSKYHPF